MRKFLLKILYFSVFLIFSQNALGKEQCVFEIDKHFFTLRLIDITGLTNVDTAGLTETLYTKDPFLECYAEAKVVDKLQTALRNHKFKRKNIDYRRTDKRISIYKEAILPILNSPEEILMPEFYTVNSQFIGSMGQVSDRYLLVSGTTLGYLCNRPTIFGNTQTRRAFNDFDIRNSSFFLKYIYHKPTDKLIKFDGLGRSGNFSGMDRTLSLGPNTKNFPKKNIIDMGYKIQGIPRQPNFETYDCDSKLKYSKTRNVNLRLVGLPLAWTENQMDIPEAAGGYLFGVVESTYTYKKLFNYSDTIPRELRKPF